MPYDVARARARVAVACAELGDREASRLERDAAGAIFDELGAVVAVDAVAGCRGAGLTAREREVVRLVAAGRSNREIGGALRISTHTVARHLQNIFVKLDVSSRVALTAYAYEHQLV